MVVVGGARGEQWSPQVAKASTPIPGHPPPRLGPRNLHGLRLSHLGQLLAEPLVLLTEFTEGLGSFAPTVLLL